MEFYTGTLLFDVAKLQLFFKQLLITKKKMQNDFIILLLVSDAYRYCRSPFSKDINEVT